MPDNPLSAAISGASSIAGGIIQGYYNRREAEKNRGFQANMSNTAYQRGVRDLEAAGLNPMLAYMSGAASTPSGSSASMNDPITPGVNSALAASRLNTELDVMRSTDANIKEDTKQKKSQIALNKANENAAKELATLTSNNAKKVDSERQLIETELPGARTEEQIDNSWYGKALRYVDRASDTIGSVLGSFTNARRAPVSPGSVSVPDRPSSKRYY